MVRRLMQMTSIATLLRTNLTATDTACQRTTAGSCVAPNAAATIELAKVIGDPVAREVRAGVTPARSGPRRGHG